jgi:chemotaxis protein methyltransferase CheR
VPALTDQEFTLFQSWLHRRAGIALSPVKKSLVANRLQKRILRRGLPSFSAYYRLLDAPEEYAETQHALDLLTTNETYFFREPRHFEFLRIALLPQHTPTVPLRVWSAACSSGEEPYSIAMTLAAQCGHAGWEILASDLSTRVLESAARGQYSLARADGIPPEFLRRYCLKGIGPQAGTFKIAPALRQRVTFAQINLNAPLPTLGRFDVIFLRNVMIYFDVPTKAAVVRRLAAALVPGGHFLIGHSESLHGLDVPLTAVKPAIYRLA